MEKTITQPGSGHTLFKRWIFFIISLFVMAFGVAFSVKSDLGTSPISSFPYAISTFTRLTIGQATICMHVVLVALQILILRKDYKPLQLIQLPVAFAFGYLTDFAVWATRSFPASSYSLQWLCCIIGITLVAVGVSGEVVSHATVLAGEGFSLAVCQVSRIKFSNMKIIFDVSLVCLAIVSSLIFTHHIQGVREGTLAAAICVGLFSRQILKPLRKFAARHLDA